MRLLDLLQKHKAAVTEKWLDKTLATYPLRTSSFFKKKKDQFANPVGHVLASETTALFEILIQELETPGSVPADRYCSHLEDIIKIRSVQEFTPSEAISFVFLLKQAIREQLAEEPIDAELGAELAGLETRIDGLAMFAFDIYTKCRERLYELRVNEIKRTGFRLLKKANLISGDEDLEPEEDWAMTGICRPRGGGQ